MLASTFSHSYSILEVPVNESPIYYLEKLSIKHHCNVIYTGTPGYNKISNPHLNLCLFLNSIQNIFQMICFLLLSKQREVLSCENEEK